MAVRLFGTIIVNVNVDGEYQEVVISASDFGLEAASMRHIGDGDYQYEALYVYYEGDVGISCQVTNFQGSLSQYPFSISGDIDILEDALSVQAIDYEPDDYF